MQNAPPVVLIGAGRYHTLPELFTDVAGCCWFQTQVKLLYGPMLAIVTASNKSFEAMLRQNSPDGKPGAFATAIYTNPQGPEAQTYRMWMKEVMRIIPLRFLGPQRTSVATGMMSYGGLEANNQRCAADADALAAAPTGPAALEREGREGSDGERRPARDRRHGAAASAAHLACLREPGVSRDPSRAPDAKHRRCRVFPWHDESCTMPFVSLRR